MQAQLTLAGLNEDVRRLERLRALRRALPSRIHMGAEDWRIPEWGSLVWPKLWSVLELELKGLRAYADHPLFSCLALNSLPERTVRTYAAQLPTDFKVVLMADPRITQPRLDGERASNPHFLDADLFDHVVWRPAIQALGPRLAVVVLTFPDRLHLPADTFAARLESFVGSLRTTCPVAVELRDPAMLSLAYARTLAQLGAAHVFTTAPGMPSLLEQWRWVPSGPITVFRLSDPAEHDNWQLRWESVGEILRGGPNLPAHVLSAETAGRAVPQLFEQGLSILTTTL